MKKKFCCPKCGSKLPFKKVFTRNVTCKNCKASLIPGKTVSPYIGVLGGISVIVPAYTYWYFAGVSGWGLFYGLLGGLISLAIVCLYTYRNTEFVEKATCNYYKKF